MGGGGAEVGYPNTNDYAECDMTSHIPKKKSQTV